MTAMKEENRLPKSILDKAVRSGNEFGWRQSDFIEVIETAKQLKMAIVGGQVQYSFPDGTCELYWLSYDPTPRQQNETWENYCNRSASECLDKFQKLILQTNIEKDAVDNFEFLKNKKASGINISDFLIFKVYFDDCETDSQPHNTLTVKKVKRLKFLKHFLKLFGVESIEYSKFETGKICGTAVYDPNDTEEQQDFCWYITEENVPSDDVFELIEIIIFNDYNKTDLIIVPADEIFEKTGWHDRNKFNQAFDKLFEIEIKMVDNGKETDSYFLHY